VLRSLDRTEIIPLVFAMVIALVTGVSSLYAGNAAFGSLGDYVALFLLGAGVDQAKNIALRDQEKKRALAGGDSTPSDKRAQDKPTPPTGAGAPEKTTQTGVDKPAAGKDVPSPLSSAS
jgi:hypothetical protein